MSRRIIVRSGPVPRKVKPPASSASAAGTALTTKGDLHGYDSGDTRIPVGTNTHVLTADSAQALGVKWAAAAGGAGGAIPEWVSYLAERQGDETPHTDDDFFGSDSSGDYTEQTVSGTGLWTIGRGVLSSVFDSQADNDLSVFMKSITSASAPMTIETRLRTWVPTIDTINAGIVFTDGTATSSKSIIFSSAASDANYRAGILILSRGSLTSFIDTNTAITPANAGWSGSYQSVYLRLIWKSANTWQISHSMDGNAWLNQGLGDTAFTMTPTHVGFGVSTRTHASEWAATFDYLRVYDADLSV